MKIDSTGEIVTVEHTGHDSVIITVGQDRPRELSIHECDVLAKALSDAAQEALKQGQPPLRTRVANNAGLSELHGAQPQDT